MSLRVKWVPIGEFRVCKDPQVQLVTVIGPCVALALYDAEAGIAGLLQVVHPGRRHERRPDDHHAFYADTGVPLLVEEMVNHGACRDRLQATVVGGAMSSPPGTFGDLGRFNVEAVTARLQEMGVPMVVREVLGQMGRRITLTVSTGLVSVKTFPVPAMVQILQGEAKLPPKYLGRLAREVSSLRPDPRLSALVMDELHQSYPDWWAVRRFMGLEPLLAAHFYRLANSPSYGHPREIASLEEALNLLGGEQLRHILVLAATGRDSGGSLADWGMDHKQWRRHGLATAVIARHLGASHPPGFREEAFTAGLLHGLGLAGLAYLGINAAGPGPVSLPAYPGCGPMGGMLLSVWNLPLRLARAVAEHESPGPPGEGGDLAVFIHAACGITNLLGFAVSGEPVARPLSPEVLARVGLSPGLAGALPGILGELRSWGLLDMGNPDAGPSPGPGEAYKV